MKSWAFLVSVARAEVISCALLLCLRAFGASAEPLPQADVYIIGERHGFAPHHAEQAAIVADVRPTAVIFEQLTGEQADRISPDTPRDIQVFERLFGWSGSGWPDLSLYFPIMTAADAVILGAAGSPGDLSAYDLDTPLAPDEQVRREALQADAHCGTLPPDRLPEFVARQRALDAQFAARTLAALDAYGGPVVLVTGNGHARRDWGVPAAIARVRPEVRVLSRMQEGGPTGEADRCAAFR